MKKIVTEVLLCIFVLLLFLDFKVIVLPIAQDFLYGTPMSGERSVSAKAPEYTPTPTPFQPVWNTPEVVIQPSSTAVPTLTPEITPEPSQPENRYGIGEVQLDGTETIEIWFYPISDDPFKVEFFPVIPIDGPDTYKPGIHTAGVWADDFGNISINPHSGCFKYSKEYVELEGEYLRRYLEGGKCNDVSTNYSDEETNAQIEKLKQALVVISQNGNSAGLSVVGGGVIKYENLDSVKSLNPLELAALVGVTVDEGDRIVVVITSGRDFSHRKIWFSAERLIIVLKEEK